MYRRSPTNRVLACYLLLPTLLLPISARAAPPESGTASFVVLDEVFAPEVEEVITISINHVAIGTMSLGPQKIRDKLAVTVPAAAAYRYDLCGHAKITAADGKVETFTVDNAGTLDHLQGRILGIFNGDDYVTSHRDKAQIDFLRDMRLDAQSERKQTLSVGHSCPDTVAEAESSGAR